MVRSGVGVVGDARVSKPSFTSPTPQARRRAARARLGAQQLLARRLFGRCHTPILAARELSSDLRSYSHTPDAIS